MIYLISILIGTFFVVAFYLSLVNAPKRVVTGPTNSNSGHLDTVMAIKPTEKKVSGNDVEYRLSKIKSKFNLEIVEDRVGYLNEAVKILATLDNEIEQDVYIPKIAKEANASPEAIKNAIKRQRDKQKTTSTLITLMFETCDCSCPYYNLDYIVSIPENVTEQKIKKEIRDKLKNTDEDDTYEDIASVLMDSINYGAKPFKYGETNFIKNHFNVIL